MGRSFAIITQANVISHKVDLHEMTESVKPRRRYQSARRAAQAAQTRRDIVTAAGLLFRERGYGVPLAEIASEAGVVVETVYRIFGSKAALFGATVEALLAGGAKRAEVPVGERPAIRAIHDEPDPRRQIAGYAATQPGIHRRAGPLLRALRDARGSDPELGRLWEEMEAWRLEGQGRFVRMLADRGVLRPGLTVDAGIDVTWTLCSLAVYDLLALERGWSDDRYQAWLTHALVCELVGE
jgi:TetR/AcrR family transcriptional regulator, regulator of autoinduction and epiphytic fitness